VSEFALRQVLLVVSFCPKCDASWLHFLPVDQLQKHFSGASDHHPTHNFDSFSYMDAVVKQPLGFASSYPVFMVTFLSTHVEGKEIGYSVTKTILTLERTQHPKCHEAGCIVHDGDLLALVVAF